MYLSIYISIYLSWWRFGESSVSGSRVGNVLQMLPVRREETIPPRFQSPSKPAPPQLPPSFYFAISRGANEPRRGVGGRGSAGVRQRGTTVVQMRWSSHAVRACVFGPSISYEWGNAARWHQRWKRQVVTQVVCVATRPVARRNVPTLHSFSARAGRDQSASTMPGWFQLMLILGCFCTDTASLHKRALCQLAVRKKPFRHPAHSHAKHSSHFWKLLGSHPCPCSELHTGSLCVRGPEGATWTTLTTVYLLAC